MAADIHIIGDIVAIGSIKAFAADTSCWDHTSSVEGRPCPYFPYYS